jgi:small ligand-binding sensory domain FIST
MTSTRVGVGLAVGENVKEAGPAAAQLALCKGGFDRADAAICALILGPDDSPREILHQLAEILGTEKILGLCVEELMDGTLEISEPGAVCVFALQGVQASLLSYANVAEEETASGQALLAGLRGESTHEETLVLLGFDCLQLSSERLLEGLSKQEKPVSVIGLGVSPGDGEGPAVWAGRDPLFAGVAALVLEFDEAPRTCLIPSWRCEETWRQVTRVQGNWILEIDGQPALPCYRKAAGGPSSADLARAGEYVFIATSHDSGEGASQEVKQILDVVGFSEERGGFALAEALPSGTAISFAYRDGHQARGELQTALESISTPESRGLLYLGDRSRGEALFGVSGLESGYLSRAFPGVPVAGLLGARLLASGTRGLQICNHSALAIGI